MPGHDHASHQHTTKVLRFSLAATFVYIVVAVVVGIRARSLALISAPGRTGLIPRSASASPP